MTMKRAQRTWPNMRVRATKFGGKQAAESREDSVLNQIFPTPGDVVRPEDSEGLFLAPPDPWELAKGGARTGSLGALLASAIASGRVALPPGLRVPMLDPREMAKLREIAKEITSFLVQAHYEEAVGDEKPESWYALQEEVETWPLSEDAVEFIEVNPVYWWDASLGVRRMSLATMRRAFYSAIFRLDREAKVKKSRPKQADIEDKLWAALRARAG